MNKTFNKQRSSLSISTIISLSLVCFITGFVFLFLIMWPEFSNRVKENVDVSIYIKDRQSSVTNEEYEEVKLELKNYMINSIYLKDSSIVFKSKADAAKEFSEEIGEDFVGILDGFNPLLSHFDMKIKSGFISEKGVLNLEEYIYDFWGNDIIHELSYDKNLISTLDSLFNSINLILMLCGIIFIIVSFSIINNTIRLAIYSQRLLIRTMRLVGATNLFIQKPYLRNSLYQGLLSGIIGIIMMISIFEMLRWKISNVILPEDFINIALIFGSILIFGMFISWISTLFAIKKYLTVNENELFN